MRILYIANSRLPTEKAHGLQIMKTIEAFLNEGVLVTLLIPKRNNPITASLADFYSLKKVPVVCFVPNFVWFLEKPFHHLYFFLQRVLFGFSAFVAGLFSSADVIYSREITITFFLALCGKKVVFEDHEPKKSWHALYRFFVRHIRRKVVVAKNLTTLYESIGVPKSSYVVAPNGVDLDEFNVVPADRNIWKSLGVASDKKIILYVGHFYAWKGVYDLIAASAHLTDFDVVLIGGTSADQEKIRTKIQSENLSNILVFPFVPHKEIIQYIKSADVLVLPNTAKEERSQNYTTPIKLFEYMASGVPIVATDIPSFSGYLKDGENAYMCKADDPKSLASTIGAVLANENDARVVAAKAKEEVNEYTWENRARKILGFISAGI